MKTYTQEEIEQAREFGRQAYHNDVHAAALDTKMMAMIGGGEVGDSIEILKAWNDGHTTEMLNAPIEEETQSDQEFNYSLEDIPYNVAYAAYSGNSMSPERRARDERQGYVEYLDQVVKELLKWDVDANPERGSLHTDIQRFIEGYKKRKLAHLHAMSRHYSAWVAGPSNYPAERMRKRMESTDKRMNELVEYCEKAINAIHKKHNYHIQKPIESGDPDAISELQKQLEQAQRLQDIMKAANRICRKKSLTDDEKVAQLVMLDGITAKTARKLLEPYMGQVGFPAFELTNNNAKIRRIQQRIAAVSRLQNAQEIEYACAEFDVSEDAADNRIRIEFQSKPSRKVCDWLNSHAWHWSRYHSAWQRKITTNARRNAQEFIDHYTEIATP